MEEEVIEEYQSSLDDLTANSKPLINMLTMLAEDNEQFASQIVQVIETQLQQVEAARKLPILYLIDSVIKNLPKSTYPRLFSNNLVQTFCGVFEKVDEKTRQNMYKVRQTWSEIFSNKKLYAIDVKVSHVDPAWPITAKPPTEGSIHVNPKFLYKKDEEEAVPSLPSLPAAPDEEETMRQQLIDKQAELLRLQQQRLELELRETKAKLEQQQQINKKQESMLSSNLGTSISMSAATPSTGITSQTGLDPRTASRDPRTAARDPRLASRDPRLSNKPTSTIPPEPPQAVSNALNMGATTSQPIPGSDPLSVLLPPHFPGIPNPPTMMSSHVIPPGIPPPPMMSQNSQNFMPRGTMPPQPPMMQPNHLGGMVPFPMGQMPPIPRNMNNQALPTVGNASQQQAGPSIEAFKESTHETNKKGPKEREPEGSHGRNRRDPRDSRAGNEKKEIGRRGGESNRKDNRDSKERIRDPRESRQSRKSSSPHPHHDRERTSGRDSKGKESREEEESRHKKKRDGEEGGRGGKSEYQDDKKRESGRMRTRGKKNVREDVDKKEVKPKRDSKEKSPSRKARSRSPIHKSKDASGGSKAGSSKVQQSPRKKVEEKMQVDTSKVTEQKEASEEKEEAVDRKPMLEAGYRIPKKEPVQDKDDRQRADKDERQSKPPVQKEAPAPKPMTRGNSKRDLSEVEDTKPDVASQEDPNRMNKKPRLEVDSSANGESKVKLNEDISDLFGCEDQDYRSKADVDQRSKLPQTPSQKGWAQYKADHPTDFAYELEHKAKQDIDHRTRGVDMDHRSPLDMDHRKMTDRSMAIRPGMGQPPTARHDLVSERDADFRQIQDRFKSKGSEHMETVLSLDNRVQIIEQIEKRRKSGELSHTDEQALLKGLSELDMLRQRQLQQEQMDSTREDLGRGGPPHQREGIPRYGGPPHQDGPSRDVPPHRDGPPSDVPPHRDGPPRDVPPHRDGPPRDVPLHRDGPPRDVPPHRDGPPRDVPLHRDGPPRDVPPHRDGPPRDVPPHRDGPPRDVPPHRDGPPRDMPPHRDGPPRDMPPHHIRGQRDGPPSPSREGPPFERWPDPHRGRYGPEEREYRSPRSDFDDKSNDGFPYREGKADRRGPPQDINAHMDRRGQEEVGRRGQYERDRPGPPHRRGPHDDRFPENTDPHGNVRDSDRRNAPYMDKRGPYEMDRAGPRDFDRRGGRHETDYRGMDQDIDARGSPHERRPPHDGDKFHDRRGPPEDRDRRFRDDRQGPHDERGRFHDDRDRPDNYHPSREPGMHGPKGRGHRMDWDRRDRFRDRNRHSPFDDEKFERSDRQSDEFREDRRNTPPPPNMSNRTPNRFRNQFRMQNSDPRWANLSGMMGSENSEEFVIDGKPYSVQLGAPPRRVRFGKGFLSLYADPNERCIKVDNIPAYRFGDYVRDVSLPPDNRMHKVFYHGAPRLLWIDGVLHELRLDAPPKIIIVKDKDHTIKLDGRDGMILLDKTELGPFGGPPRFVYIDENRCELRFDPPPRQILIDGNICELKLDRKIPCVMIDNVPHGIRFDGPPREVIVNGEPYTVPMDRPLKIRIHNRPHFIAFGGPAHEAIFDGRWFEVKFGGPPKQITVGNRMVEIRLEGNSPDVKILEPIKDPDLMVAVNNIQFGPNGPMPRPPMAQPLGPQHGPMMPPGGPGEFRPERPIMPVRPPGMMERPMGPQNMGPMPQMPGPQGPLMGPQGPMIGQQGPMMGMPGPVMGPPGPMMGPPSSVMGPIPPQVAPGEMVIPGMMPGQPGQPGIMLPMGAQPTLVSAPGPVSSATIPGLVNPGMNTMPGMPSALTNVLASAQAPPAAPQIDVGSLFEKLLASGIISKPDTKETKPEVEEKKPVIKIPSKKLEEIPDLLDLKADKLKKSHSGVMQRMYCGIQCTSCGLRFTAQQTERYREHLDWHFRQNQREKEGSRISRNRKWFYDIDEWIQYEEIDESEERVRSDIFEQTRSTISQPLPVLNIPDGPEIEHCPTATGEENGDVCEICGDTFEQFFDEEQEEWLLKDAVRSDGKTYHPVCYEDAREGSILEPTPTPTPSKGPEDNPLIMQIKKELGQLPADTVIHYKDEMIVKPKIKTELPDPESTPAIAEPVIKQEVTSDTVVVKQEPVDTS